jgi:creatinine amidohydrolase
MTERRADPGFILPNTSTDNEGCTPLSRWFRSDHSSNTAPNLSLVTEALIAITITDAISRHRPIFQLPPITFGCSHEHTAFPGTVRITATTLAAVIGDITTSLAQQGINGSSILSGQV